MKPNLFVIGASKCGTTSLHDYLAMHPDILMSTHKEPGYFVDVPDRDGCLQPAPGTDGDPLEIYLRLFPNSDAKRYVGESTTNYTLAPRHAGVPRRIARFCPDARLIYIVRDPIERTISHYWYWCLTEEEFGPSPLKAILRDRRYLDASYYAMQLREYLPHFPREQIYVMCVEDLLAAPAATMGELFNWLGLSLPYGHSDERYRERKNMTPQVFAQARTLLHWKIRQSQTFGSMRLLIPRPLRKIAWRLMNRTCLTTRRIDRSKVDLTSTIEYLRELQVPQAREFEVLVGREFRQWRTLWKAPEPTALPIGR
jgi:hypothetical protein